MADFALSAAPSTTRASPATPRNAVPISGNTRRLPRIARSATSRTAAAIRGSSHNGSRSSVSSVTRKPDTRAFRCRRVSCRPGCPRHRPSRSCMNCHRRSTARIILRRRRALSEAICEARIRSNPPGAHHRHYALAAVAAVVRTDAAGVDPSTGSGEVPLPRASHRGYRGGAQYVDGTDAKFGDFTGLDEDGGYASSPALPASHDSGTASGRHISASMGGR
jgi:hypothetical protein